MVVFAIAPALLPAMSGLSAIDIITMGKGISEKAHRDSIACKIGRLGMPPPEFNLYTDLNDAGADYENYYALDFQIKLPLKQLPNSEIKYISVCDSILNIRIFDEMVAVAYFNLTIDINAVTAHSFSKRNQFDHSFVQYTSTIVEHYLTIVNKYIASYNLNTKSKNKNKKNINLMLPNDLLAPKVGWVHKVFIDDKKTFGNDYFKSTIAKSLIAETTIANYKYGTDYYGWGDSIKFKQVDENWRQGCIISQYYYFVLDRFNRRIPNIINDLRIGSLSNDTKILQNLGLNIRHRILEKEIAYADCLHGIAGAFRNPIEQFDRSWRFTDLRKNLSNKIPILQDVLTEAQIKSQTYTNKMVETLLFFVSFMSLIGVLLNSHDYAIKTVKDKISTTNVLAAMMPFTVNDILSFAVGVALVGLLIFAFIRFEFWNKISN